MFNFFANADEVSVGTVATSVNEVTPNWKAVFGDWWALAAPN